MFRFIRNIIQEIKEAIKTLKELDDTKTEII